MVESAGFVAMMTAFAPLRLARWSMMCVMKNDFPEPVGPKMAKCSGSHFPPGHPHELMNSGPSSDQGTRSGDIVTTVLKTRGDVVNAHSLQNGRDVHEQRNDPSEISSSRKVLPRPFAFDGQRCEIFGNQRRLLSENSSAYVVTCAPKESRKLHERLQLIANLRLNRRIRPTPAPLLRLFSGLWFLRC